MPILHVNGAELYYEAKGTGIPVLFIMGASGDGGHFSRVADLLADEFTVIIYDRRGCGRSPRAAGWQTTSPAEQADDAAALLGALGLESAAVFGTSSGGTFALCLTVRHPASVRGCILHEPVLARLYDDPEGVRAAGAALVAPAMAEGGPALVMERFWRLVAGDANWSALDAPLRDRMRSTAGTFVEVELGTFEGYLPDDDELSRIGVPVLLLVSEDGRIPQQQAVGRLAQQLEAPVQRLPGTHMSYWDHPHETSDTIRTFLRQLPA